MSEQTENDLLFMAFKGSAWGRKDFNNKAEVFFGKEARQLALKMWKMKLLMVNGYGYVNPTKLGCNRLYELRDKLQNSYSLSESRKEATP